MQEKNGEVKNKMTIEVFDKRAQIVVLTGRQTGLEWKIKNSRVFDHRRVSYLCNNDGIYVSDPKKELVFLSFPFGENEKVPFIDRPKQYVVSAFVPKGYFWYSCCGSHVTDPEYVAIRTDKECLQKTIDKLGSIGQEVIYGKEIDLNKFQLFIMEAKNNNAEKKVREFMQLSSEEQKMQLNIIFGGYK